jgi:hypothetical protein
MQQGDRLATITAEMEAEFPGFRIIPKASSRMQRAIHKALIVVTFGGQRSYLEGYHTTVGRRIYVTSGWEEMSRDRRWLLLRHERVHMRQFRRFTFVGMSLLYVLVPLPLGLAYFRARFEKEAYTETIRGAAELYGRAHVEADEFRQDILVEFTGPSYGWMWPFRRAMERWYDRVLAGLPPAAV